jgi:hypothetical protein
MEKVGSWLIQRDDQLYGFLAGRPEIVLRHELPLKHGRNINPSNLGI